MEKHKKLLENLEKTTTQETQETNFTRYLEDTEDIREIRNILQFMRETFIIKKDVEYIDVNEYIHFFQQIPKKLWSEKRVFYFKDGKFDALGLIGERIHNFSIHSKTLQLYFLDIFGLSVTRCIDGYDPKFIDIKDNKERFLRYLYYIRDNASEKDLRVAFHKAKKIYYGRYY